MSRQLHFPVALNDTPVTLHVVLPGTTVCARCGASMFAARFAYTDRPDLLERMEEIADSDTFGMIDPVDGCVRPVRACTTPQAKASKPQRAAPAGLTQITANMVHAAWHNVYETDDTLEATCPGLDFVDRLHQAAVLSGWSADDVASVVSVCVAVSQVASGVPMDLMRQATEFIPGLWARAAASSALHPGATDAQVMTRRAFFDLLDEHLRWVLNKSGAPTHAAPGVLQ